MKGVNNLKNFNISIRYYLAIFEWLHHCLGRFAIIWFIGSFRLKFGSFWVVLACFRCFYSFGLGGFGSFRILVLPEKNYAFE